MSAKKPEGTNRVVVSLSNENYLWLMMRCTKAGSDKPAFGAVSEFVNAMIVRIRELEAIKGTTP